jgi:hypothetical protein
MALLSTLLITNCETIPHRIFLVLIQTYALSLVTAAGAYVFIKPRTLNVSTQGLVNALESRRQSLMEFIATPSLIELKGAPHARAALARARETLDASSRRSDVDIIQKRCVELTKLIKQVDTLVVKHENLLDGPIYLDNRKLFCAHLNP